MKRLLVVFVLVLFVPPAVAGLRENRALKEFQDNEYPGLKKQVAAAAGFDVPIEVNWNSIKKEKYEASYRDAFTKVYFIPIINALKKIGEDKVGKSALKGLLKKVIITNSSDRFYPDQFSFTSGVLTIDLSPIAGISDVEEITARIIILLEKGL